MTDSYNVGPSQDPQTQSILESLRQREDSQKAEASGNRFTPRDCWDKGVSVLESLGVYIEVSGNGSSYGVDFYNKHTPNRKGLNCPTWFKPLKQIDDPAILDDVGKEFSRKVSPEVYEFWSPMFLPQGGEPPISHYVRRKVSMDSRSQAKRWGKGLRLNHTFDPEGSICGEKAESPITWVPERQWFQEGVFWQKADNSQGWEPIIRFRDIFTIFPEAELQILKLLMGRMGVGRPGHVPPNWVAQVNEGTMNPVSHTARMAVIVLGDAGVGKSTLFQNYLIPSVNELGFTASTFRSTDDRFGLGEIISSHLSYKDDTSFQSVNAFLRAETTKAMITGGAVATEEKFQAGQQTLPKAVFLLNANRIDISVAYDLDEGIISRVKIAQTYRNTEMSQRTKQAFGASMGSPNLRPFHHIPWLADKYGVDPEVLFWWALRLATDYFWDLVSHQDDEINFLEQAVNKWSSKLRIQFKASATTQILKAALLCSAMAWQSKHNEPYSPPELSEDVLCGAFESLFHVLADPVFDDLKEAIKGDWELQGRPGNGYWNGFRQIQVRSLWQVVQNRSQLTQHSNAPFVERIKQIMSMLVLRDGSRLSGGAMYVNQAWEDCRFDSVDANEYAKKLLERFPEVKKLFDPSYTTNHRRILEFGYSPDRITGSAIVKISPDDHTFFETL